MSGTVRNMKLLILLLYPALILSQDSDYLLQELKSLRAGKDQGSKGIRQKLIN